MTSIDTKLLACKLLRQQREQKAEKRKHHEEEHKVAEQATESNHYWIFTLEIAHIFVFQLLFRHIQRCQSVLFSAWVV